jgi:hypothetical protein
MDREDIAHRRLNSLRIVEPAFAQFEEVVRWLGAVQSQDYPGGKWGIGHRCGGLSDAELDRAFNAGELLRTHVLRPTWHFVLPSDIRWMLELTGPRVHALNTHYSRQFGVHDVLADGQRLIAAALEQGDHLTRKELQALLERNGIRAERLGLAYVLMYAELNGVICSGVMRGKQHTYALLEQRAPAAQRLSRDEALAELTRRYFVSHGPATIKDYGWWSSLTATDIKRGLDLVGSVLDHEDVDGVRYWFDPSSSLARAPSPSLFLLQGYDEYFVGYTGASKAVLDLSNASLNGPEPQGALTHVIVQDSQVVGRWQRTVGKSSASIQVQLLRDVDDRALKAEVERYGRFLQVPAGLA